MAKRCIKTHLHLIFVPKIFQFKMTKLYRRLELNKWNCDSCSEFSALRARFSSESQIKYLNLIIVFPDWFSDPRPCTFGPNEKY